MLVVVDTNHLSELDRNAEFAARFAERRRVSSCRVFTSVVTVQEITKGWLALLNRCRTMEDEVIVYARFQRSIEALKDWDILPFDRDSGRQFTTLVRQRIRIGTMDLKIAAICLAHDCTLLTRNLADFGKVPGLRVENWLD